MARYLDSLGHPITARDVVDTDELILASACEDVNRASAWDIQIPAAEISRWNAVEPLESGDPAEAHQIAANLLCVRCDEREIWDGQTQLCESCEDDRRFDLGR